MYRFSQRSLDRLFTCHVSLQQLFQEVIKHRDCTVLCGVRSRADQEAAVAAGNSRLHWPAGKHNVQSEGEPSLAVDVAPWKPTVPHVDWRDEDRFYHFAGFVLGVASQLKIPVRWGGDWDRDHDLHDQSLNDLVHFELLQ